MTEEKQIIAVLGASNIGGTLGRKWHAAGHTVAFGVSDPQGKNAQAIRADLGNAVSIGTTTEVLRTNPNVVLIATPPTAVSEIVSANAAHLNGRTIIDATNRIGEAVLYDQQLFQRYVPKAHIFRAFNTLGWENFVNPLFDGVQADLFFCGAPARRAAVDALIRGIGLNPIYLGDVDQAELLDGITKLWFTLALKQGKGRHLAFKVLTDQA
ncbi:NADPH-dependent F420 reductase [Ktedonosporobacter rubrisoli]|nr:NAD(P)-binding domain-containing protein [Ktedonosporobacter rubrisoli]